MGHLLLQIPVPEVESVVRPRHARRAPEYVPADPDEIVAHITLLSPFADLDALDDGLISELRGFFGDVLPFPFRLTRISQFPGGVVYLSPEPSAPFRQMTHELFKRFPEFPPNGAQFDEVVPHLSVPIPEGEAIEQLRFELDPRLPITAHAREAALYAWEPGGGRTLETFAFGTTAA